MNSLQQSEFLPKAQLYVCPLLLFFQHRKQKALLSTRAFLIFFFLYLNSKNHALFSDAIIIFTYFGFGLQN